MAEIKQTLGFEAGAAITTLGKLKMALDLANASLVNFAKIAKSIGGDVAVNALKSVNAEAAKTPASMAAVVSASSTAGTALKSLGSIAEKTGAAISKVPSSASGFAGAMSRMDGLANSINAMKSAAVNVPAELARIAAAAAPAASAVAKIPASAVGFAAAQSRIDQLASRIKILKSVADAAKPAIAGVIPATANGFAASMARLDAIKNKITQVKNEAAQTARVTRIDTGKAGAPAPHLPSVPIKVDAKEVTKAEAALKGLRGTLSSVATGAALMGITFRATFQLIWQAFKSSVGAAREFGLAMAEIKTISDPAGASTKELTTQIIALSSELGKSAKDVAEGYYQVLSNQVVDAADAMTFLADAERLAITTHATTAESVDALSSVINSYGLKVQDTARVSDILFETVFQGRLRLDEIADRIGRITPMAAQMGVRFEEVGAAISVMTVQGVKADTAITQLRAVMSKLLKPTAELQKIFDSWGVVDGEDALRTFGGLYGVLQKLTKETGNSSAEMAKFFNVVRSMTGVMGLGTSEGERFRAAIDSMDASIGKAAKAWEIFLQSDAQKLTQQMTALKNSLLELGLAAQPMMVGVGEIVLKWLGNLNTGLRIMGAAFGEQTMESLSYQMLQESLAKKHAATLEKIEVEISQFDTKEWRERDSAYRQMLAGQVVAHKNATDAIKLQQSAAMAVYQNGLKELSQGFKDSFKGLEDFVNKSTDRIKDALSIVADMQKKVQDRNFDAGLKGKSDQAIAAMQNERFQKAVQKASKLSGEAGADPEKFAAAQKAFDIAEEYGQAAIEAAKVVGNIREIDRLESRLTNTYALKGDSAFQYTKAIEKAVPAAKVELTNLQAQSAEIDKLVKKLNELSLKRDKGGGTDAQQKQLADEIKTTEKLLADAFAKRGSSELLKSLGLETAADEFQKNFQKSLDKLTLDFSSDMTRFEAEANKIELQIRAKIIPTKESLDAIESLLGRKLTSTESVTKAAADATTKLAELDTERVNTAFELAQAKQKQANTDQITGVAGKVLAKELATAQEKMIAADENWRQTRHMWDPEDNPDDSAEQRFDSIKKLAEEVNKLEGKARSAGGLGEGDQERLAKLNEIAMKLVSNKDLSQEAGTAFNSLVQAINGMDGKNLDALSTKLTGILKQLESAQFQIDTIKKMEPIKEESKAGPTAQESKAAVDNLNKATEDLDTTTSDTAGTAGELGAAFGNAAAAVAPLATAAGNAGTSAITVKDNLTLAVTEVGNLITGWFNVAPAANGAVPAIQSVDASTVTATGKVYSLEAALYSAADAAWALAEANAAAGAPAASTAFSGGKIDYLAAGGRGQDNIHAVLAKGEFVSSAKTTGRFFSELNAMNNGSRPVHREQGGAVTNVGDVNVTVKGGDSSQQTVREIGHALRREIQRGNIKLK